MKIKTYNQKAFLLPDSINSMAAYHAKIKPDGEYQFRLHDCNTGIRLIGELSTTEGISEATRKLHTLSIAARNFAEFIEKNYKK